MKPSQTIKSTMAKQIMAKRRVWGPYTMLMGNLFTKDNGRIICTMESVNCLQKTPNTGENSKMERRKDVVIYDNNNAFKAC